MVKHFGLVKSKSLFGSWQAEENYKAYEKIRDLCQFGTRPVEGKVVVQHEMAGYSHDRYRIISNPIGLPIDLIALFCDSGNLRFGYHTDGTDIYVHTD